MSCSSIIPLITPTILLHCKRKAHFYPSNPVPLASHIFLVFQFHHQFSSFTQSCPAPGDPMDYRRQAYLSITISLLKLISIELVMPSNHLILCNPLLLLPSIFPISGCFPRSQFTSGGQSIGVSASGSVVPKNFQD